VALIEKNENKIDNSFKDDTPRWESNLNKLVNEDIYSKIEVHQVT
jgi:hypothetical protein